MIDKILEGIGKGIGQLLPRADERITVWLSKLATLTVISFLVFGGLFVGLRDTSLGRSYGINSPPAQPKLSNKEYRDIYAVLYTYLLRIKEEVPELRGVFFIAVFDKQGNINFADEDYDRIAVFTWYLPVAQYVSFQTFEEVLAREKQPYLKRLGVDKDCFAIKLNSVAIDRYRQAIPNFASDRAVMCPVPNNDTNVKNRLPFGGVIAFWVNDPKKPEVEQEMLKAAKFASDNIGSYLLSRTDLNLNR